MLKRIGFGLAFCIVFVQGNLLLADVVSRADARVAAANWIHEETFQSERPYGSPSDVQTVMSDGREIVHVVSFGDGGWVVTSTDDRLEPVLAFSKSGSVETLLATPFVDILAADLRSRRIAEGLATTDDQEAGVAPAVKPADETLSPCQMKWRRLLHPATADLLATTSNGRTNLPNVVVAPLITTKWSQGSIGSMPCFNYYTPDHLQSGCVATTMAQLMRYHRYPVLPVESRPYPCKLYGQDVELTLMGGCYDWDAMVDEPQKTLSETAYQAIGKLMYDCGVALGNEYKTYSTSAYTKQIVPALLETFGYYSAKRLDLRDEASLSLFNSLATNDLARARPVVVSLHGANSGHSILVDGYGFSEQTLYYHLNFGWAGFEDAWYTLPKVQTTQSSYSLLQEIIYDVVPVDPSASPVARAVDNMNLEFTTGGTSAWVVSTNTAAFGPSCVQSGKISRGASTWLETVVDGCGVLSFWWCCDTGYAIFGSDDVSFMIDGVKQSVIHGQTSWQELTYTLSDPGEHTLRWIYEKDAFLSLFARSDCAWVDAISWKPVAPTPPDPIIQEPIVPSTTVVSVSAHPVDDSRGKVSGAKDAQVGRTVTLKATPNKGFAFGGWYVDRACTQPAVTVQATDFRTPTWGYTVTPADAESGAIQFWAKFVGPDEDLLELGKDFMPAEFVLDERIELEIPVRSVSLPSISVSGLPTGLKYDTKRGVISGIPTRPTARPAVLTIKVKNPSGYLLTRQYAVSVVEDRTCEAAAHAAVVFESQPLLPLNVTSELAEAGKVTGSGVYAAGTKVALKATAAKGFVFVGWYQDLVCVSSSTSWSLQMPTQATTLTARFVTTAEDAASVRLSAGGLGELSPTEVLPVVSRCGIAWSCPVSASALSPTTIKVTGLPSGLKFTAKDIVDAKTKHVTVPANTIYGTPTAASKKNAKTGELVPSQVVLTVTTSGKSTQRYTLAWTVEPLPAWAVGTFTGAALDTDGGVVGQSTVTVSTAGKISGKILVQGKTWKIAAAALSDESEEGTFHATITGTCGKETLTEELTLRADELGGCLNGACLCAVQNNWKVEPWKSAAAKIAKKPKLTIPVDGDLSGEVVLSFGTAGTVKAAGCFVMGVDAKGRSQTVKVSCSSVLSPLTAANPETGSCVAETVIYFPAKGTFPGWVQRLVIEL